MERIPGNIYIWFRANHGGLIIAPGLFLGIEQYLIAVIALVIFLLLFLKGKMHQIIRANADWFGSYYVGWFVVFIIFGLIFHPISPDNLGEFFLLCCIWAIHTMLLTPRWNILRSKVVEN